MLNRKLILLVPIFMVLILFTVPAMADVNKPVDNDQLTHNQKDADGLKIVRVYFDDIETAHALAKWIEPIESNYEKGYLVLEVTMEQYFRLEDDDLN